jgi:RimJ/RimL family protein N-acetyltransferase
MIADLKLLEVEIDTLWLRDTGGRLERRPHGLAAPHLVIAVSSAGWTLALGSEVSDALAAELEAEVSAGPPSSDPTVPPTAIARCKQLLRDSLGPTVLSCGPSYLIPGETTFSSAAEILRSGDENIEVLHDQDLERLNWPAEEWRELLDGSLGPWAMAMIGDQVVSICHSARLTERGAEAGVWTDPGFRGQGHAAAVTAAWAALLAPSGRHLFYSTYAANVSSQRVAERLHLRPIGWMWKLAPTLTAG